MTNRKFSQFAASSPEVKELLECLIQQDTPSESYRTAMERLGHLLAKGVLETSESLTGKAVCVVCTVEDADFLASGLICELENTLPHGEVYLQCIWNEKVKSEIVSLSPVLKQYSEPFNTNRAVYIVVKSIISSACVVKTNLTRALSRAPNADVFVVAPVLLEGAQQRLEQEFPDQISNRFKYVWFATDSEKDGDNVRPGIGGSVYERLGLGNEYAKNKYLPEIVKKRRAVRFAAM